MSPPPLSSSFQNYHHFSPRSLSHLPLEDLAGNVIPSSMEEDIYQSRLQIVLLSPIFLDFLYKNPTYVFGKLLHPDRVLAIMLGVKDAKIKPEHRAGTFSRFAGRATFLSPEISGAQLIFFNDLFFLFSRARFILPVDPPGGQGPRHGVCPDSHLLFDPNPQSGQRAERSNREPEKGCSHSVEKPVKLDEEWERCPSRAWPFSQQRSNGRGVTREQLFPRPP